MYYRINKNIYKSPKKTKIYFHKLKYIEKQPKKQNLY